jgi:hypothetical protein
LFLPPTVLVSDVMPAETPSPTDGLIALPPHSAQLLRPGGLYIPVSEAGTYRVRLFLELRAGVDPSTLARTGDDAPKWKSSRKRYRLVSNWVNVTVP